MLGFFLRIASVLFQSKFPTKLTSQEALLGHTYVLLALALPHWPIVFPIRHKLISTVLENVPESMNIQVEHLKKKKDLSN